MTGIDWEDQLEGVEFPSNLDNGRCIEAVGEVANYLVEHEQKTRDQLWDELVLNTDRQSPGRELCRKMGYVPKFRDWWWDSIIVVGLRAIPDFSSTDDEETRWQYSK